MQARLVFQIYAPSHEVAHAVMMGAIEEFLNRHPGVLLPGGDPTWYTEMNLCSWDLVVECDSQSKMMFYNEEMKRLIAKNQRATGIEPETSEAIVISKKKKE